MNNQRQARKIWANTLRSGKYQCSPFLVNSEDRLRLKIGNKFSFLGIACELYRQLFHKGKWDNSIFIFDNKEYDCTLPEELADFYGFDWQGLIKTKDDATGITLKGIDYLVEVENYTENEIIDLIENSAL